MRRDFDRLFSFFTRGPLILPKSVSWPSSLSCSSMFIVLSDIEIKEGSFLLHGQLFCEVILAINEVRPYKGKDKNNAFRPPGLDPWSKQAIFRQSKDVFIQNKKNVDGLLMAFSRVDCKIVVTTKVVR